MGALVEGRRSRGGGAAAAMFPSVNCTELARERVGSYRRGRREETGKTKERKQVPSL
jgi:hypothetical protein